MKVLNSSFNGGEVTPLLEGRYDLDSLRRSCRKLRNYIPLSIGAAVRRPSLLHHAIADTVLPLPAASLGSLRLHTFTFNITTQFVLGFCQPRQVTPPGDNPSWEAFFYVWDSEGVLKFSGSYLDTGYDLTSPSGIIGTPNPDNYSFAQVNDILIVTSSNFPPVVITRVTDTNWTVESMIGAPNIAPFGLNYRLSKPGYYPPFLDDEVPDPSPNDLAEGVVWPFAFTATGSKVIGGAIDTATMFLGPCPATWRLYTGTTAFVGTIFLEGADTNNAATWEALGSYTNASTGAMVLRGTVFCGFAFLRVRIARTSGTATLELRHLGSLTAPTAYVFPEAGVFGDNYTLAFSPEPPPGLNPQSPDFDDTGYEFIQLTHLRNDAVATIQAVTGANKLTSKEIRCSDVWSFYTTGIWVGSVYLEVKGTTGEWDVLKQWSSNKDQNHSATGHAANQVLRLRCVLTDADQAANGGASTSVFFPRFTLTSEDARVSQWVQVYPDPTAGTSAAWKPTHCLNRSTPVLVELGSDTAILSLATNRVGRGAFSQYQGYPAAVCVHGERLYFAGTTRSPARLFGSSVNDLFNFRATGLDDGALSFSLASTRGNSVQWMMPTARGIIAGTSGEEWLVDGGDIGITPSNVTARLQSHFGSEAIMPLPLDSAHIFVRRGGAALCEYTFEWGSQNYEGVDPSELVKHITGVGVRAIAFSRNPEPVLWCVMNDGGLLTVTYNRQQQVIGWAKHSTAGTFEAVTVIEGRTSQADEVWFIVLRNSRRRLERLDSAFWAALYTADPLVHLDAAVVKTGAAFTSMAGCSHLVGLACTLVTRGASGVPTVAAVTPASGTVTTPAGTTHAVVGLAYTSELQPMPFDLPLQDGTTKGRVMHTPQVAVQLFRSAAGKYADSATATLYDMKIPSGDYTGILRLPAAAAMRDSCEVYFKTTGPLPLNFTSVVPSVNVYGT
jgi:hypothetical protein